MRKWEYLTVELNGYHTSQYEADRKMEELGMKGWELVTGFGSADGGKRFYFKRELINDRERTEGSTPGVGPDAG